MKKQGKKIILSAALLSLATIPVASISMTNSVSTTLTKVGEENHAVTNPTTSVEIRLNKNYKSLEWYNKKFSSSVSEENLKELLQPNIEFDVNWGVNILTPTDGSEALSSGYVEFSVYQIQKNISDGVSAGPTTDGSDVRTWIDAPDNINYTDNTSSSISMKANLSSDVEINGVNIPKDKVWTTKNIQDLFLPYKYNFSWNTNDQIGEFLSRTSDATLTAESIYSNMISTSSITDILPKKETITKLIKFSQNDLTSDFGVSNTNATKYGVGKININFTSDSTTNNGNLWASGNVPNITKLVRGLGQTKEKMHFNVDDDGGSSFLQTVLNLDLIRDKNPNFKTPAILGEKTATEAKISDFTPSELINALTFSNNGSSIFNLLTTQDFLKTPSSAPALYLTYMGSNMLNVGVTETDSATQWKGTGLFQQGDVDYIENGVVTKQVNAANESNIISITPNADDVNGILNLKVVYNYYDVFKNVIESNKVTSITIEGMQQSQVADDLFAQWKSIDNLLYSNINDVSTAFNNNKDNAEFLKSFSNSFFSGSQTTYDLDRQVNITTSTDNVITITLTFPEFGREKNFVVAQDYQLESGSSGINFNSQSQVQNSVSDYGSYSPNTLIDAILNGKVSLSNFVSAPSGSTTIVTQNSTNDGIVIQVTTGNSSSAAFYTGLQKSPSVSFVYNFAFSDDTDETLQSGLATLRSIPIEKITNENVYEYYISKLPVYNGANKIALASTDIKNINKNLDNNSIDVSILVPSYNSADKTLSEDDRTFSITLNGFISEKQIDDNSSPKITDLTIPLSVSFAVIIVLIMIGLLVHLILKQKRLSKSKINLKELRESSKTKR
ncbi:MAG: hypothetical protein K2H56_01025 [Malacoplasma sp.]|nr:hypothetical protein [Malacoplasma sp.]